MRAHQAVLMLMAAATVVILPAQAAGLGGESSAGLRLGRAQGYSPELPDGGVDQVRWEPGAYRGHVAGNRNVNVGVNRTVNVNRGGPGWGGVAAGVAVGVGVSAAARAAANSAAYPPPYPYGYAYPYPYPYAPPY